MRTEGPVEVVLAIERTAGTISGQLAIGEEEPVGFFGWLELIDRLERAAGARTGEAVPKPD
jgi:hypothetical protein